MDTQMTLLDPSAHWRYWIALRLVRGVGNVTFRELLTRFGGSPQAVLQASLSELINAGAHDEVARAISTFDQWRVVDLELQKIAKAKVQLVTRADSTYPEILTHLHDPPPFLYVRGSLAPEDQWTRSRS
jgi:DNA processing protein